MMDYIVHNLFSTEAGVVWLVLKWALVVLAAGFIGQFGKAFAAYLIRRAGTGKGKGAVPATRQEAPPPAVKQEAVPPAATQAAEALAAEGTAAEGDVEDPGKAREKEEKKARKEQQKAAKKTLKGIQKLFK
jgi:hypothetical protein